MGIVDPDNTRTQPPRVAASTGLDVLINALESYTAIPFNRRPRPERPRLRPLYQGSNFYTDAWALHTMDVIRRYIFRAVADPSDEEARRMMLMAVSIGKVGFSYAGCHLPHSMSYPVAAKVRDYRCEGYPSDRPLVPHGISVLVTAPAVFRFTAPACPDKHLKAAEALGGDISGAAGEDAGRILSGCLIEFMERLNLPNGLSAIGYNHHDIPRLVQGTLSQQRLLKLSPRPVGKEELERIFEDAMIYW
jgi:hydroxyacid-oxoacid transhydrogenase